MNKFKIPFSGRNQSYDMDDVKCVTDIMMSKNTLTQGKQLKNFEKKFENFVKSKNCFAVSSATAALEIIAQLCNLKKGDEVVIPSHTYTSSAYPFIRYGAKIVWCDIDITTRVISPETINKCISNKTRVIVVPHLYGYCADMPKIVNIAKKNKIIVVEDAAQAIGSVLNKKFAGTFGDFGVFSFHSHKNISTLGEGGMLYVKSNKQAQLIQMLRHNGHCNFSFKRKYYWKPAMGNLDLPSLEGNAMLPNNFCITEAQCALGSKQLKKVKKLNKKKRDRANFFIDSLRSYQNLVFHKVTSQRHNYHLLCAMDLSGKRDKFIYEMASNKKIQCVVQYYPLNRYPLYKKLGFSKAKCPNADRFFDNMISFPFQETLTDDEINQILESTKEVLKKIS